MKKLLLCVNLNDKSIDAIKTFLKTNNLNTYNQIHIVHSYETNTYVDGFYVALYPAEELHDVIKSTITETLNSIVSHHIPNDLEVITKCLISHSSKYEMTQYIEENAIDEAIIATRSKNGIEKIFSSSFAEYMIRNAKCDMRILRS